jgi:hypothetical protein
MLTMLLKSTHFIGIIDKAVSPLRILLALAASPWLSHAV